MDQAQIREEKRSAKVRLAKALREQRIRAERKLYKENFKEFVKACWTEVLMPGRPLQWNWHLDIICEILMRVHKRELKRVIINVPPRCTKSTLVSVCYQVWVWINDPSHQFLCLASVDKLAIRDAVKSRNIMRSAWFQERWGHVFTFAEDQNTKGRYENSAGGHRISQGLSTSVTGEGGDTVLIDDPHDAKKVRSDVGRQNVLDNYDDSVEMRLNDPSDSAILIIMQRLHSLDLCGHVLAKAEPDEWLHLCFPNEYWPEHPAFKYDDLSLQLDPRKKRGELFWPERISAKVTKRRRSTMSSLGYAGQFQQWPVPEGGAILKKHWWRPWPRHLPVPEIETLIHSWDTAYSDEDFKKNSRSAMTAWGVFWNETKSHYCLLLVGAMADHWEYPDLRKKAKAITKKDRPDICLIEKKASGQSLIQDLRRAGVSVSTYNPDKDKITRAYSVSAMLESGQIYYIQDKKWSEEVMEECAAFPNGAYSDYVDTCTQAWIRARNMFLTLHPEDGEDEDYEDYENTTKGKDREAAYG